MKYTTYALIGAVVAMCLATSAQATLVTFDNLTPTSNSLDENGHTVHPGAYTYLPLSAGGVSFTITREEVQGGEGEGATFDLVDNTLSTQTGKGSYWGSVSLDVFSDTTNYGMIFTFSDPIVAFSLRAGDYGRDLDSLELSAYTGVEGLGDLVDGSPVRRYLPVTSGRQWTDTRFDIVSEDGFRIVKFIGGADDFDVYIDRIYFSLGDTTIPPDEELDDPENQGDYTTILPEPATIGLLMAGLVGLKRRHK